MFMVSVENKINDKKKCLSMPVRPSNECWLFSTVRRCSVCIHEFHRNMNKKENKKVCKATHNPLFQEKKA